MKIFGKILKQYFKDAKVVSAHNQVAWSRSGDSTVLQRPRSRVVLTFRPDLPSPDRVKLRFNCLSVDPSVKNHHSASSSSIPGTLPQTTQEFSDAKYALVRTQTRTSLLVGISSVLTGVLPMPQHRLAGPKTCLEQQ